jgi:hypothetical protein
MISNPGSKYSKRYFRNYLFLIILLFTSFSMIYGQRIVEEKPPLRERLFIGGNFGLQFGTLTDIQVSPVVGLWVLPRLAIAVGPDYRFYKYRTEKTNIIGAKGYMQFVVIKDITSVIPMGTNTSILLHVEDEVLSLESAFWKDPPVLSNRFYINTLMAGGGISQQIGRRSSMNIMVLWALNDSGYDIYSTPEVRVSFNF